MPRPPARPAPPPPPARPATTRRPRQAAAPSIDRIAAAAAEEFASRGFAGARVDRIAARAGLNKAMLYYHHGSKEQLYRTTIRQTIGTLADRLEAVAETPEPAEVRIAAFIDTFTKLGLAHPGAVTLLVREIVEGATHIDRGTVSLMLRLVRAMTRIVQDGRQAGTFRDVNPLMVYLTTIWPILLYVVSTPARALIVAQAKVNPDEVGTEAFISHLQDVAQRTLAVDASRHRTRSVGRPRESRS